MACGLRLWYTSTPAYMDGARTSKPCNFHSAESVMVQGAGYLTSMGMRASTRLPAAACRAVGCRPSGLQSPAKEPLVLGLAGRVKAPRKVASGDWNDFASRLIFNDRISRVICHIIINHLSGHG